MKRYKHIGTQPLALGAVGEGTGEPQHVKPGDLFEAALEPAHERFLVQIGAIAVLADASLAV